MIILENVVRDLDFWSPELSMLFLSWEILDLKFILMGILTYICEATTSKSLSRSCCTTDS